MSLRVWLLLLWVKAATASALMTAHERYEHMITLCRQSFIDDMLATQIASYAYADPKIFPEKSPRGADKDFSAAYNLAIHTQQAVTKICAAYPEDQYMRIGTRDQNIASKQQEILAFVGNMIMIEEKLDALYERGAKLQEENPGIQPDLKNSAVKKFIEQIRLYVSDFGFKGHYTVTDDQVSKWASAYEYVQQGAPMRAKKWMGMTGTARGWGPFIIEPLQQALANNKDGFAQRYLIKQSPEKITAWKQISASHDWLQNNLQESLPEFEKLQPSSKGILQYVHDTTSQLLISKLG